MILLPATQKHLGKKLLGKHQQIFLVPALLKGSPTRVCDAQQEATRVTVGLVLLRVS